MAATRTGRLDRRKVADTALRLLNEVGLEGLTLRGIAAELQVKAPALYWHFKDKQALLDEMATEMLRRMGDGLQQAPEDWREAVARSMGSMRENLLRYRDGARVFSGTRFTDTSFAGPMEANLAALTNAGFTPAAAARAWHTAYSFTIGFVIEEQAMSAVEDGASSPDLEARAESLEGHPLAARAGYEYFRDYDRGFEEGLRAVIAGVAATLLTAAPGEPPGGARAGGPRAGPGGPR
ncbi:TetR/AcrR family transcriptional regulator C-terminal domain-containing protein [Streptomyces sp. TS71-3]|uniref:TetR/AcrR family transcriptional regulator C-terminal domain-containing protein n=1 Tax=Streptomyces sp. TS71-3 TaxID=2733862 RepID=UPI001B201C42|nr:TetR/AcrR family transcriptional regulator C-terminal domain-containing protein [Streptomyces sp. TS71-3]GHJ35195.1 TetR family transcriptional regulator [Streptomyces sp. TS71-3]